MIDRREIVATLGERGLRASKKLGQNFLVSAAIRDRIVDALAPGPGDHVLEVGPGLGALTELLIERAGAVTAVELDGGLATFLDERLGGRPGFSLVRGDYLKTISPPGVTAVLSNIPYYCSTEILFKMADEAAPRAVVMLQREVAERITARPDSGAYGALTVTLGYYYAAAVLFSVPPGSFFPRPGVSSSVLRLERRATLPLDAAGTAAFHRAVKSAFWGRRKTMLTALAGSPHLDLDRSGAAAVLAAAGIDPGCRGETLGQDAFVRLGGALAAAGH